MIISRTWLAGAALLIAACAASPAGAAVWAWGCASAFDKGEQILFNRYILLTLDKPSGSDLRRVIDSDGLDNHPHRRRFDAYNVNSGFEPRMPFKPADGKTDGKADGKTDGKTALLLTEISSKRLSYREGRAGPRDEFTTRWRKVYRISGADETPRAVKMECMEYMLSTKGGRD